METGMYIQFILASKMSGLYCSYRLNNMGTQNQNTTFHED